SIASSSASLSAAAPARRSFSLGRSEGGQSRIDMPTMTSSVVGHRGHYLDPTFRRGGSFPGSWANYRLMPKLECEYSTRCLPGTGYRAHNSPSMPVTLSYEFAAPKNRSWCDRRHRRL